MCVVKPQTARLMEKIDRDLATFGSADSDRLLLFLKDLLGKRYGKRLIAICLSVDVINIE